MAEISDLRTALETLGPRAARLTALEIVDWLENVFHYGTITLPEENYEEDIYPIQLEFSTGKLKFLFQINPQGGMEVWRRTAFVGTSMDDFSLAVFMEEEY